MMIVLNLLQRWASSDDQTAANRGSSLSLLPARDQPVFSCEDEDDERDDGGGDHGDGDIEDEGGEDDEHDCDDGGGGHGDGDVEDEGVEVIHVGHFPTL